MATQQLNKYVARQDLPRSLKALYDSAKGQKQQFISYLESVIATTDAYILQLRNDLEDPDLGQSGYFNKLMLEEVENIRKEFSDALIKIQEIIFGNGE